MIYFHVFITIRAERFETFVILSRHAHVTHGTISYLFAVCFASKLVCLMFFETRATSKAVTGLTQDSFFRVCTRRNRPAITTRLSTLMRRATFASFITASAHILSRLRTRKTVNNVKMFLYGVIYQVNSFVGFCLAVEIYVLAMQSSENNDPVLFKMFLESH